MVATDRETATGFRRTVHVHNVLSRPTPHVDNQGSEILLVLIEYDLRRREWIENDVEDFDIQFLDAADAVFDPRPDTMNDVKIGFELPAEHPDRIQDPVLTIDVVVLQNGVQKHVLRRDADLTGT